MDFGLKIYFIRIEAVSKRKVTVPVSTILFGRLLFVR